MKKIIFTALLLGGFATAGISQERPQREKRTPEQRAQSITDALDKKLSLSQKQKSDIYNIHLQRAKEMERQQKQAREERKKAQEKTKKEFQASENKINKVLSAEQKAKYAELKTQRADRMKKHRGERVKKHYRDSVRKEKRPGRNLERPRPLKRDSI